MYEELCIPNEVDYITKEKKNEKRLATHFRTWTMYKATNQTVQAASALMRLHNHDSL